MPGKLWVVPTPIGNLEDITLRALRILREVDIIFSEDTRTTGNLLRHYEIDTPMRPYHLNNEHATVGRLVELLAGGTTAALVSDAGTPAISDPGFLLVRQAVSAGVEVECLPGPVALVPAIVMSAFPSERFLYEGFLPVKKGRQKRLQRLAEADCTVVLYESPHRICRLLGELADLLGPQRQLAMAREMTKIHATIHRGTAPQLLEFFTATPPKGEFVVVISPPDKNGQTDR